MVFRRPVSLFVGALALACAAAAIADDDHARARAARGAGQSGQLADTLSRAGEEGHFLGDTEPYNAVVLDLRRWRAAGRTMPVLIHARLDPHGPRQLRPRRFRVSRHALGYGDGEWIPRRTSTATPTPSKCSSQARRQC